MIRVYKDRQMKKKLKKMKGHLLIDPEGTTAYALMPGSLIFELRCPPDKNYNLMSDEQINLWIQESIEEAMK